jgi:malate/lactate dehydrogenase
MIRTHRADLAKGRSQAEILELRQDAKIVREITARFSERNADLTAMEDADAALVMANADATGRTKREKLIKANPFLERFTVTDLRNWADRKMQVPRL